MDLDINQYISIFIEESKEHLQSMNDVLLELEKEPTHTGYINEIFRVAHTIKGMAGTMGFSNMANLTHEMENVLQATRNNELKISEDVIDILFKCFDAMDESVNNIIEQGIEKEDKNEDLIDELKALLNQGVKSEMKNQLDNTKPELDSYLINLLKKAKEENLNVYKIRFTLTDDCMLKAARAFIIFNTLEEIGEIISSIPSVEEIEDEKFDKEFDVIIITDVDKEKLEEEISNISEVESTLVEELKEENFHISENKDLEHEIESKEKLENNDNSKKNNSTSHNNKVTKTVRVDIDRLDNLMNLVSELIIIKTRMDELSGQSTKATMNDAIEYLERITTSLHDAVMKVRMVPIERVFNRFPRLVRDLSKDLGKEIDLEMSGEETEVDRTVIDEIGDPLIHLIRNSIDHGIEMPEERIKAGKDKKGSVILKAYPDGNNVVIEVQDNGKGLDVSSIKNKAIQKDLINEKTAENLSDDDIINLLFAPGFSTAETVSDVSGRGVGLDVVKSKIESISGNIEVQTEINKGSRFIIRIPLTLAIIQALLVKVSEEIYAIPLSSINEITEIKSEEIRDIQGKEVVLYRGETLPIIRLKKILDLEDGLEKENLTVVVAKKGDKQAGFIIDGLIGQQEIVIKSLGKYLSKVKYLSGATILGNGNISLILDVNSLI